MVSASLDSLYNAYFVTDEIKAVVHSTTRHSTGVI